MAEPDYRHMWDDLRKHLENTGPATYREIIRFMDQMEHERRQRALQVELDRLKKGRTP